MKLRLLAMASVAAAALSTPAFAGDGWYLGLGGGYSGQQSFTASSLAIPGTSNLAFGKSDNGIGVV